MRNARRGTWIAALLLLFCSGTVLARNDARVPAGVGQRVFNDVPVVPGSYPAATPHRFAVKTRARVKSLSFDYDTAASALNLLKWYRARLPAGGWHIQRIQPNFPAPGAVSILANRRGEAVTIVIEGASASSQVSIVKLDSSR